MKPVILAMDTSLGACSVALWSGGGVAESILCDQPGQQSRKLILMLEEVLDNCNQTYENCDAVACTIGPGGFTSIRVGLAAARTIRLAIKKPLIGLTTLETIAYGSRQRGDLLAVIDASRGQFYVQRFRNAESLLAMSEPMLVDEKMLPALSHGAKVVRDLPHAELVAELAYEKWSEGLRDFPSSPLYIREPDAKIPA